MPQNLLRACQPKVVNDKGRYRQHFRNGSVENFHGRRWDSKDTTSGYLRLDVRRLQRDGLLAPGQGFSRRWLRADESLASINVVTEKDRVILSYKHRANPDENWRGEEYPVSLEWTKCHYGGMRAWFLCPVRGCGRRVAILFGGDIFACRHCHKLAYESQQKGAYRRALSQAQAIRSKLGGSGNMTLPFPDKPKGMHWSTYQRLSLKAQDAESRYWPRWLKMVGSRS
jgi:hypothetical protein